MKPEKRKASLGRLFSPFLRSGRPPADAAGKGEEYRRTYECFREILSINDSILQLIADIEDKLLGQSPFILEPIFQRSRKAVMEAFLMINNLNEISYGRYLKLHDALGRIQLELEAEIGEHRPAVPAPYTIQLKHLHASDAAVAGTKMANLGEVSSSGFEVPDGFVITTEAFRRFMSFNNLWDRAGQLESILESFSSSLLDKACREMQQAILASPLPEEVRAEIFSQYDTLASGRQNHVAMRSSAVQEDTASSYAGQYYTELDVTRELLEDSYRTVVSSMYKAEALLYRFQRGLNSGENPMAVGCLRMLNPVCSGVMFSRQYGRIEDDRVAISARAGLNVGITSGTLGADEIVTGPDEDAPGCACLTPMQVGSLRVIARKLEHLFGSPQDIEWAIEEDGKIVLLQSRPMTTLGASPPTTGFEPEVPPILTGGLVACPGTGSGPVYQVRSDTDLQRFPDGGVIVARHSSPIFSRVMTRCAAIVTEIGSPIGHMAILAREFDIPAIVGMKDALRILVSGMAVTVDASGLRVFEGEIADRDVDRSARFPLADSPVIRRLKLVARLIAPLNLIDPAASDFRPAACRSLHDITRFVHEKVYEVMFQIGERAEKDRRSSFLLEARLPIQIRVFDVGGGIDEADRKTGLVRPEAIRSVPLTAFLSGLLDERIRWDQPRPISARGFMSVMGENVAGPPAMSRGVGSASFAVVSDRYMNFTTKAGYHFSTIDAYCGQSQNKNYIHFKFNGGGAALNRRLRRIRFLSEVLSGLDFSIQAKGDLLVARLDKYERDYVREKLSSLGRLTMCARQLDMLMDSDAKASSLARAFLQGHFEHF